MNLSKSAPYVHAFATIAMESTEEVHPFINAFFGSTFTLLAPVNLAAAWLVIVVSKRRYRYQEEHFLT